ESRVWQAPSYDRLVLVSHPRHVSAVAAWGRDTLVVTTNWLLWQQLAGEDKDCAYYEEVAASFITTCLEMKNSPLVSWEGEIRKILSSTKNQHLSADLLLTLGKKSIELGNIANAIEIYEEVIDRYSELYIPDDEYSDFRAYSLEAFLSLLDIYKNQGNSEKQLQRVKKEMKNYYENLHQMLATRGDNYSIKQLESDFEKYVH
ncbi:hypothetical protein IIA15_10935, partial [candidate division TA06 bacterium]|nr:hypothetical protein [candidate division TA06 bacterium]